MNTKTTGTAIPVIGSCHLEGDVNPTDVFKCLNDGYLGGNLLDLLVVKTEFDINFEVFDNVGATDRNKILKPAGATLWRMLWFRPISERLQRQSVFTYALSGIYDVVLNALPARLTLDDTKSANAEVYQLEVWSAICNAKGFDGPSIRQLLPSLNPSNSFFSLVKVGTCKSWRPSMRRL